MNVRPTRALAIASVAWMPLAGIDLTVLRGSNPYFPFFPYLFIAVWFFAPLEAAVALITTLIAVAVLGVMEHFDTLPNIVIGDLIALAVGVLIIFLRERTRQMQDGLRRQLAEHEKVVSELLQAEQETSEALRLRDDFLAAASHDLRTPLTAIMGWATLMQSRLDRNAEVEARWFVEHIAALTQSGKRMARTIEGITDAAHLQVGQVLEMHFVEVDISAVIDGVVSMAEQTTPCIAINRTEGTVPVAGDRARLESVFQNIVDNALKFRSPGSLIHISLNSENGWVWVAVRDQGIGIPPAELPYIFQRFYRASNADVSRGGIGVGLATVKAIVEQHGGHVDTISRVNEGTTITVWLPLLSAGIHAVDSIESPQVLQAWPTT